MKPLFVAENTFSGNNPGKMTCAGFWRRLLAAIIDLGIILLIDAVIVIYTGTGNLIPAGTGNLSGGNPDLLLGAHLPGVSPGAAFPVILLCLVLVPWLYYALLESSQNQATLGKMTARIIVTDLQGMRLTFARATLRHFSKYLSALLCMAGFVCILYTRYQQGLHDIIGACLVLYQEQKIS